MYPLIRIPAFANKDIYAFSKEEAKEYYKWFTSIKNDRIQILESEVQKIYPEWKLNFTRNSLCSIIPKHFLIRTDNTINITYKNK